MQAGCVRAGQQLLLMPGSEILSIKALTSRGAPVELITAGDHAEVTLDLKGASLGGRSDGPALCAGSVLCDPERPVPLARRIEVTLRTFAVTTVCNHIL
jgi:translation elongation factor EF-1alpha